MTDLLTIEEDDDELEKIKEVSEKKDVGFKTVWREYAQNVATKLKATLQEDEKAPEFKASIKQKDGTETRIIAPSANKIVLTAKDKDGKPKVPNMVAFKELIATAQKSGKRINFGNIKTPEFKARLLIACMEANPPMQPENAPEITEEFLNSLEANSASRLKILQNKLQTQQEQKAEKVEKTESEAKQAPEQKPEEKTTPEPENKPAPKVELVPQPLEGESYLAHLNKAEAAYLAAYDKYLADNDVSRSKDDVFWDKMNLVASMRGAFTQRGFYPKRFREPVTADFEKQAGMSWDKPNSFTYLQKRLSPAENPSTQTPLRQTDLKQLNVDLYAVHPLIGKSFAYTVRNNASGEPFTQEQAEIFKTLAVSYQEFVKEEKQEREPLQEQKETSSLEQNPVPEKTEVPESNNAPEEKAETQKETSSEEKEDIQEVEASEKSEDVQKQDNEQIENVSEKEETQQQENASNKSVHPEKDYYFNLRSSEKEETVNELLDSYMQYIMNNQDKVERTEGDIVWDSMMMLASMRLAYNQTGKYPPVTEAKIQQIAQKNWQSAEALNHLHQVIHEELVAVNYETDLFDDGTGLTDKGKDLEALMTDKSSMRVNTPLDGDKWVIRMPKDLKDRKPFERYALNTLPDAEFIKKLDEFSQKHQVYYKMRPPSELHTRCDSVQIFCPKALSNEARDELRQITEPYVRKSLPERTDDLEGKKIATGLVLIKHPGRGRIDEFAKEIAEINPLLGEAVRLNKTGMTTKQMTAYQNMAESYKYLVADGKEEKSKTAEKQQAPSANPVQRDGGR